MSDSIISLTWSACSWREEHEALNRLASIVLGFGFHSLRTLEWKPCYGRLILVMQRKEVGSTDERSSSQKVGRSSSTRRTTRELLTRVDESLLKPRPLLMSTTMLEMADETSSSLIGSTGFSQASSYIELARPFVKRVVAGDRGALIVEFSPKLIFRSIPAKSSESAVMRTRSQIIRTDNKDT